MKINKTLFLVILGLFFAGAATAQDDHSHGNEPFTAPKFEAGKTMLHHVLDTHNWHITDYPVGKNEKGERLYKALEIPLPWLFYSSEYGLQFYLSTEKLLASGHYEVHHDKLYHIGAHDSHSEEGHEDHAGGAPVEDGNLDDEGHVDIEHADHAGKIYDFSPTKTVVQMILILGILIFVMIKVAKGYKKNEGHAPKGIQSFIEPVIIFVRDEISRPYLGEKSARFLPYLLSLFFFIWFANLFGIMPFNSNIMGNISITFTLALFTFFIVQFNGTKDYWRHIFAMPGVPKPLWLLITPIELFGVFTKPIALMIRLFANIAAGHFMILALVSLIFIMGKGGESLGGALGIMPLSVAFTIFIFCLEVIVGAVQAYVFVLLTAVFLGQALEKHDHH